MQRGDINLHLALTVFLGIGTVLFGVLAVVAYQDNTTTQHHVNQLKAAAASQAATTQQQQDAKANTIANEQPYRTYTAPAIYGGFQVSIPKDWSVYATINGSSTPFDLLADPNYIQQDLSDSATNTHEFELKLVNESVVDVNKTFDSGIKKGTVASKPVTVSGIAASWFEGAIDNQRHNGIVVTFPDRNQTVVITTDTHDFVSEFTTILSSAKFSP